MTLRTWTVAAVILLIPLVAVSASNIGYTTYDSNGIKAHVVTVNMNSPRVKVTPALCADGVGSSERFSAMIERLDPKAAITGTFFCTRNLIPVGDIVIEGERVNYGVVGVGVCVTPANTVEFVPMKKGHKSGWLGYETVLCGGPTLVRNSKYWLSPRDEGFSDPELYLKKKRAAVGVTANNKLLFVTVNKPVYLRSMAGIMLKLGCAEAVSMDGGSSTALYWNGSVIAQPKRKLTNLLVAYDNRPVVAREPELFKNYRRMPVPMAVASWPVNDSYERAPVSVLVISEGSEKGLINIAPNACDIPQRKKILEIVQAHRLSDGGHR